MHHSSVNKQILKIALILFVMYFTYLLYRLFFFAYGQYYRFSENEIRYNIIPFKTIGSYIVGISNYKLDVWFFNLFGNVLAFVPMGFLLPLIFSELRSVKAITITTFITSTILEVVQLILRLGITDIDDIVLNTIGGLMGYLLLDLIRKILISRINGQG